MKKKNIIRFITLLAVLIYTGVIVCWHLYTPDFKVALQIPGADNRPEGSRKADDVNIGEFFMRYAERASTLTGKWPGFRGSDYKNIVQTGASFNFSSDFPLAWKVETGEGHAAPVIYNGKVYFLDYEEKISSDALRCFDLETGKPLWKRWYRVKVKRNHGFSRTVPVINDKCIVTFGPMAHVMCCDPITGDLKWTMDLRKQFETEEPKWYSGQCPRIDDDQLILAPAGKKVLMIGVNYETGEILWQTPNTPGYKMSHSSVTPMIIQGKKTYVYAGEGGICGVSGEVADKGKLLWNVAWKPNVVAPSPLQLPSGDIMLTAGYSAGSALLQVKSTDEKWTAKLVDQYKPDGGLSSEQQTPILYNQMVITIPPKDGGGRREKVVAYSPDNIRTPIWESTATERFGLGPYMIINNHLFVLKQDGELYVYKLEQNGMTLVKRQRIIEEGHDAWGPLAFADGYLVLRDADNVFCLKIE